MSNICSIYWDNGFDKPSYIFLPDGITICSDDTRQGWLKKLLSLIDCYNKFASKYGANLIGEEQQLGISALDGMQSGYIRIMEDYNAYGCWELDNKCISRLVTDEEVSPDSMFHIPRVQVLSLSSESLDHDRLCVGLDNGVNTLILDCSRICDNEKLVNFVVDVWNNKLANQVFVLVSAGFIGNRLCEKFCERLDRNCVVVSNGAKSNNETCAN